VFTVVAEGTVSTTKYLQEIKNLLNNFKIPTLPNAWTQFLLIYVLITSSSKLIKGINLKSKKNFYCFNSS
jgi:hypothetical protein